MINHVYKLLQSRSSAYDNYAFKRDCDLEETTVSENNTSEEMYENVFPDTNLTNYLAIRGFAPINKQ